MTRKNAPRLSVPALAIQQEELRAAGVGTARDRVLAEARQKRADAEAARPRVIDGEIDSGSAVEQMLAWLQDQGHIINRAVRGGDYGRILYFPTLVNPTTPIFRHVAQAGSDTLSTTNNDGAGGTVVACQMAIVLPPGKWSILLIGSLLLRHSGTGSVRVGIEVDATEQLSGAIATVPTTDSDRVSYGHTAENVPGEQTVNLRLRYRSASSGTTTAKNPHLVIYAWRTE